MATVQQTLPSVSWPESNAKLMSTLQSTAERRENASHCRHRIVPLPWTFPQNAKEYDAKGYGSIGGSLAGKLGDNQYTTDYALRGCKCADVKCGKGAIVPGELRIGKIPPSVHKDARTGPKQTKWYHPACMFASFRRVKATTNTITSTSDLAFFSTLNAADQEYVSGLVESYAQAKATGGKRNRSECTSFKSPAPLPPPTPETLEKEEQARYALFLLAACGEDLESRANQSELGPEAKRLKL